MFQLAQVGQFRPEFGRLRPIVGRYRITTSVDAVPNLPAFDFHLFMPDFGQCRSGCGRCRPEISNETRQRRQGKRRERRQRGQKQETTAARRRAPRARKMSGEGSLNMGAEVGALCSANAPQAQKPTSPWAMLLGHVTKPRAGATRRWGDGSLAPVRNVALGVWRLPLPRLVAFYEIDIRRWCTRRPERSTCIREIPGPIEEGKDSIILATARKYASLSRATQEQRGPVFQRACDAPTPAVRLTTRRIASVDA